ncbi:MAG: fibronectin type III domain-containing protein [Spirochaetes bacterium]|nr:fibronectin type III domain-containing protein [Spirochaetota bacterium]
MKQRYSVILITIIAVAIVTFFQQYSFSEHVFLKDGSIINGTIVRDAAATIIMRTKDRKLQTIPRGNILRILYTQLNMGKIHVQMRDGKNFEAYIVDEDQKTYTFRKVLESPDELKVTRTEVLFIAERNPSGLKGEPDTNEIELSWYPPYNRVKYYLIYHKEKQEKEYRQPEKSGSTSYTLDDLKSNTTYALKTTAVDDSGEESLPSNEITVTTKNILPLRPERVVAKEITAGNKAMVRVMEWKSSRDPDGTVKEYRVYRDTNKGPVQLGKTTGTSFEVPQGIRTRELSVRAVDDMGDESETSRIKGGRGIEVGANPEMMLAFGRFGDLVRMGYGGTVVVGAYGFLLYGLYGGIDAGYYYFPGDDTDVDRLMYVPILARVGYRFDLWRNLSVQPDVSFGYAFLYIKYSSSGPYGIEQVSKRTKKAMEPVFMGSLQVRWDAAAGYYVTTGASCGFIYESSSAMPFWTFRIGAGYRFGI